MGLWSDSHAFGRPDLPMFELESGAVWPQTKVQIAQERGFNELYPWDRIAQRGSQPEGR